MKRQKIKETIEFLQKRYQEEKKYYDVLESVFCKLVDPYQEFIISQLDISEDNKWVITEFIVDGVISWTNEDGTKFETRDVDSFIDALLEADGNE